MIWHVFATSNRLLNGKVPVVNEGAVKWLLKHHVKVYMDPKIGGGVWWCVPKPLGWILRGLHLAEHRWRHWLERPAGWWHTKIDRREWHETISWRLKLWYGPHAMFLEWFLNFDRWWVREVSVRVDDGKYSVMK